MSDEIGVNDEFARPDDEPEFEERSIAQVGTDSHHTNILVVVFGIAIVALLLWFVNRGEEENEQARLIEPEPVPFEAAERRTPPRLPEPAPQPISSNATIRVDPPDPFQAEMQRIAIRRAEEERALMEQRRRAPILVVDKRRDRGLGSSLLATSAVLGAATNEDSDSLAASLATNEVSTVNVSPIGDKSYTIAQGALIRGVLETAIQSDLPGFVRAAVAHDVYSFDGSHLLIPKASRLVGQYRSGLVRGQTRVFVVWDRLLRPDGASILIGSPGTDLLGRSGLDGDLDTHFFKIFGSSILLSLVDGAIDVAVQSVRDGSDTTILQNTNQLNRAAEIALENSINIPPTIHIDQGTPIQVFVARDLNFRQVTPQ